jgi:hypothetical protein
VGSKTGWLRVDPAYLVLALLPWFVLSVTSAWIYNPLGSIDPWIYFGYFLNYPKYAAELFPGLYYGSRLSWILPGYCLNALFDPMQAKYILHVGFYYLAVFSLYGILRKAVGSRSALLAAVLFGTHSYFLHAVGWDYVDGPGIIYNLLALLCIVQTAQSHRPRLWLVASGAAAAAMFYCNAFLAVFLPFLPALYIYQAHPGLTWTSVRTALRFALWFGLGALLVSLLLGAVNHAVGGGFWFYSSSIQFITGSSKGDQSSSGWSWATFAYWLAFPLVAALGSISYLLIGILRRTFANRGLNLFFVLQYLACLGFMIAWHMAGGLGLQWSYYTSYLLPSAFLAIGCMLAPHLERWPALAYWLFLAAVTFGFVASLGMHATNTAIRARLAGWVTLSVCVGVGLILNNFLRGRWYVSILILGGLWLCQTGFQMPFGQEDHRAELARIVETVKLVRQHIGEDAPAFWYNRREQFGREFNAIHSCYLWGWAMISAGFPAFTPNHPLPAGTEGVILSSQDDALQQANQALHDIHLEARTLGTGKIDRDGVRFQLIFFRTEPLSTTGPEFPLKLSAAREQPGKLSLSATSEAAAFPVEQWAFCRYLSDGRMELRPDGLHVTTHRGRFSYSVQYAPLTIVKPGFYRFVLKYDDLNGGLQFGALSLDQSHWVVPPEAVEGRGRSGTRTAYASLAAGEQLVLMVCNFARYPPDRSSTFVIKSVRAFATFDR